MIKSECCSACVFMWVFIFARQALHWMRFLPSLPPVVVWMKNVFHRVVNLSSGSLVVGLVWESCGTFVRRGLAGGSTLVVGDRLWEFNLITLSVLSASSLPLKKWVFSWLLQPPTVMPPCHYIINSFIQSCFWSWCSIIVTKRNWNSTDTHTHIHTDKIQFISHRYWQK